ncbi:MAG: DUF4388 domain-containing protein [Cyanobacteria bacterium SZAS TMP-1]|nr:DUF4388 domain-containing protein [Cyanobacteria bacterium SZAS TMP-1]
MAKHLEEVDQIKQLIKDSKLSEACSIVSGKLDATRGDLDAELLALIAGLAKALSLSGALKQSDDLLGKVLPRVTPKDDHYFLGLADELTRHSESNIISSWENTKTLDRLIDQAIRIREELIGPDSSTAEIIIDSVMTNLQRARQTANSGLAAEAASRLTRCRTLMTELTRVHDGIARPSDLLVARVSTLRAFFAHSAGQKAEAKENYQKALKFFERVAAKNSLERTDLFELFVQQGPHFDLSPGEKQQFERLKKVRGLPRARGTMHKIRAFPSAEHISEIMQKARATKGKTFHLTSLGFLGTQSLNVSVICAPNGDLTFCIEPSKSEGVPSEIITLISDDANEVLRHIKDLWKRLQARPSGMLTVSSRSENFGDDKSAPGGKSAEKQVQLNPFGSQANISTTTQARHVEIAKPSAPVVQGGIIYYDKVQTDLDPSKLPKEALSFEGNLKTMPSLGLLQTIGLNNNTGALEVTHQDGQITIYFDQGVPVHGTTPSREGMDVLYQFVMQHEGWFRFVPDVRATKITIKVRPEQFILEAASLFDENKYLKSLGLTMFSGLFPKESLADWQELAQALEDRGATYDEHVNCLYQALLQSPIAAEALEQSDLSLAAFVHALYKLVQSGLVVISNEGLDDSDISQMLVTTWTYDRRKADEFINTLYDSRTGLLRFEFLIFSLEREFERARTQMWPLSIMIFEIRKRGQETRSLTAQDKELVHTTLAQIADTKRSIDWLCHFQNDQFALLMPGLDKSLAAMFGRNFVDVCSRNLGKLKEGQSDWEYSFGLSSIPFDTIEWPRMVGFALEAQRAARMSRQGLALHGKEDEEN